MTLRGIYKFRWQNLSFGKKFEVDDYGDILYTKNNLELLRKLWLDREVINGIKLGPGDDEEFENGAWHIACHLVAACGVRRTKSGNLLWLEISFNPTAQLYEPTLTIREKGNISTYPIFSTKAKDYISDSELLGFVEGTSEGRISAQGIQDTNDSFAGNPRQKYDQNPDSNEDGGRVWPWSH